MKNNNFLNQFLLFLGSLWLAFAIPAYSQESASPHHETVLDRFIDSIDAEPTFPLSADDQARIQAGTVLILTTSEDGKANKTHAIGSGFFMEHDFPTLHTARHVVYGMGKKLVLVFKDKKTHQSKSLTLKNPSLYIQLTEYDYATVNLSWVAKKIPTWVKPFKRAAAPLQFLEAGLSTGYKSTKDKRINNRHNNVQKHTQMGFEPLISNFYLSYKSVAEKKQRHSPEDFKKLMEEAFKILLPNHNSVFQSHQSFELPEIQNYRDPIYQRPVSRSMEQNFYFRLQNIPINFDHLLCAKGLAVHGHSGGPVLNRQLEVVGVNSSGSIDQRVFCYYNLLPKR